MKVGVVGSDRMHESLRRSSVSLSHSTEEEEDGGRTPDHTFPTVQESPSLAKHRPPPEGTMDHTTYGYSRDLQKSTDQNTPQPINSVDSSAVNCDVAVLETNSAELVESTEDHADHSDTGSCASMDGVHPKPVVDMEGQDVALQCQNTLNTTSSHVNPTDNPDRGLDLSTKHPKDQYRTSINTELSVTDPNLWAMSDKRRSIIDQPCPVTQPARLELSGKELSLSPPYKDPDVRVAWSETYLDGSSIDLYTPLNLSKDALHVCEDPVSEAQTRLAMDMTTMNPAALWPAFVQWCTLSGVSQNHLPCLPTAAMTTYTTPYCSSYTTQEDEPLNLSKFAASSDNHSGSTNCMDTTFDHPNIDTTSQDTTHDTVYSGATCVEEYLLSLDQVEVKMECDHCSEAGGAGDMADFSNTEVVYEQNEVVQPTAKEAVTPTRLSSLIEKHPVLTEALGFTEVSPQLSQFTDRGDVNRTYLNSPNSGPLDLRVRHNPKDTDPISIEAGLSSHIASTPRGTGHGVEDSAATEDIPCVRCGTRFHSPSMLFQHTIKTRGSCSTPTSYVSPPGGDCTHHTTTPPSNCRRASKRYSCQTCDLRFSSKLGFVVHECPGDSQGHLDPERRLAEWKDAQCVSLSLTTSGDVAKAIDISDIAQHTEDTDAGVDTDISHHAQPGRHQEGDNTLDASNESKQADTEIGESSVTNRSLCKPGPLSSKPFSCVGCQETYSVRPLLVAHLVNYHYISRESAERMVTEGDGHVTGLTIALPEPTRGSLPDPNRSLYPNRPYMDKKSPIRKSKGAKLGSKTPEKVSPQKSAVQNTYKLNSKRYSCVGCKESFNIRGPLMFHLINAHSISWSAAEKLVTESGGRVKGLAPVTTKKPEKRLNVPLDTIRVNERKRRKRHFMWDTYIGEQFMCDVCNRYFKHKQVWSAHMAMHTDVPATQTTETITKSVTAGAHILATQKEGEARPISVVGLHTRPRRARGSGDVRCEQCNKRYTTRGSLNLHVRRIHAVTRTNITKPLVVPVVKPVSDHAPSQLPSGNDPGILLTTV